MVADDDDEAEESKLKQSPLSQNTTRNPQQRNPYLVDGDNDEDENNDVGVENKDENDDGHQLPQHPRPPCALEGASWYSKCLYSWALDLLRVGLDHPLQAHDLPELCEVDTSRFNRMYMERLWNKQNQQQQNQRLTNNNNDQKQHSSSLLYRALVWDYFRSTIGAQVFLVISMAARIGQSLAMGLLIDQFNNTTTSSSETTNNMGYAWAGIMMGCGVVFLLAKQRQFYVTHRKGMTMRLGLLAMLYSKSLRLSSNGSSSSSNNSTSTKNDTKRTTATTTTTLSSGHILNLASNDVERFLMGSPLMIYVPYAPLEALAILAIGVSVMGKSFLAGFGLLLMVFVPLQFVLSRRFARLRAQVASVTDQRVHLVGQAVQGVRIMKMHGWEHQFAGRIDALRALEMKHIQTASRYKSVNEALSFCTTVVLSVVTFSVHVALGSTLTSRIVFTIMSLINILQSSMTRIFSTAIMNFSECYVSCARLQIFLESPELEPPSDNGDIGVEGSPPSAISACDEDLVLFKATDITCFWEAGGLESPRDHDTLVTKNSKPPAHDDKEKSSSPFTLALRNVTISLRSGELYCVIGPMGSSKSALLRAIAGELPVAKGTIQRRPKSSTFLAYAQQDPWIMDGTVRENIVFGSNKFQPSWYSSVIEACCLLPDLQQFPDGDATIVGDRGVQCSGGQRARIGLARALYRDADLVLLDDPLSAVDSKVGRHIFYKAIQELCVARGKCVVLATHQHQFCGKSKCILMVDRACEYQGSYSECIEASDGKLLAAFQSSAAEGVVARNSEKSHQPKGIVETKAFPFDNKSKVSEIPTGGVAKESRETGLISLDTWKAYAAAMGGMPVAIACLGLFAATQASQLVTMVYFGKWAEQPAQEQRSSGWFALVYSLLVTLVVLAFSRTTLAFYCCLRASRRLHREMTNSVLRARIEFFDTSPLGRILNRFSADVGITDDQLPLTLIDFLVGAFLALGSVATTIVSLPMTIVALFPLVWYFVRLRTIFVVNTREIKRLEGLARSPIYAMVAEALSGVATIRANGAISRFQRKFEDVHDQHGRAFFAFVASSRWFALRLDLIAFLFLSVTAIVAVLFQEQGWFSIEPAVLGLTLTLLMQLAGTNFPWVVRQSAEVVNQMISVERVASYGKLQPEAPLETSLDNDLEAWPKHASIVAENLSVRYRKNLPQALSSISFHIKHGQRIGIIGRTGSGKSSLVQALFRILEADSGSIMIDDVDISKVGLHKLRQNISVIPQSPVLFGGCSVRFNLDPFGVYKDEILRDALAAVQMFRQLPDGIDSVVSEGGSNFSVGERQLLCLARAMLRKSKILVLDESSANIDNRTESLLQTAIQKSFPGATVLAIAHRLETVIAYDSIFVLGDGKLLESGTPSQLLQLESGHFKSMIDSTGKEMAQKLRAAACRNEHTCTLENMG